MVLPPVLPLPLFCVCGCSASLVVPFAAVVWAGLSALPCKTLLEVLARYPRRGEGRVPPPLSSPCSTLLGCVEGGVAEGLLLSLAFVVGLWGSAVWEGLFCFHGGRSTVVGCGTLLVPWRVL